MKIDIKGYIVPNDSKEIYDWVGLEAICPKDVQEVLNKANGQSVEVHINSPGGEIASGSEIYTALRQYKGEATIYIVGEACSAASVIAMARHCLISPTALMMIHRVSTRAVGNHAVFEREAESLRTADKAIAAAYIEKTGMAEAELLELMEKETWLNANDAVRLGFADEIMFHEQPIVFTNGTLLSMEAEEKIRKMMNHSNNQGDFLLQQKENEQLNLLRLKGGNRHEIY